MLQAKATDAATVAPASRLDKGVDRPAEGLGDFVVGDFVPFLDSDKTSYGVSVTSPSDASNPEVNDGAPLTASRSNRDRIDMPLVEERSRVHINVSIDRMVRIGVMWMKVAVIFDVSQQATRMSHALILMNHGYRRRHEIFSASIGAEGGKFTEDIIIMNKLSWRNVLFLSRLCLSPFLLRLTTSFTTMTPPAATSVGFVGLGIMGEGSLLWNHRRRRCFGVPLTITVEGMAARLLSQGVAGSTDRPLVIWNRTGSKCESFVASHPGMTVIVKSTPKAVVESCSITYCMLSTPEASRAVFDGEDGTLAGVSEGKSIVDCATLAEADMRRMCEAVVSKGGRFLEAPVSGSKVPAAQGALIFLCAGSEDLFNEVEGNALKAMGKASHYFGPEVGAGTRAKLVVNSLMGTMLAAFGEGLALAQAVGLDPGKMIEVIGQGAIASPVYALKGPKMIAKDHAPHFPLKHASKDMTLASEMAKAAGVEYSVMDQAEKLYREAREDADLNVADEDFSAVFERIHRTSTSEFAKSR
jgi:3-hydroxyisobutyrate dehydrogenase-like beta-hydroxyacid dehydrogenase